MYSTIAFVTNQYSCDRLIYAAKEVADRTNTELVILEVLNSEYDLNPQAVDYLFRLSKKNKATMRMLFTENTKRSLLKAISHSDCKYVLTGMPGSNHSILYDLWKKFPEKEFFAVDENGMVMEVANGKKEQVNEKAVRAESMKVCPA